MTTGCKYQNSLSEGISRQDVGVYEGIVKINVQKVSLA
jgi:hypothetical protein